MGEALFDNGGNLAARGQERNGGQERGGGAGDFTAPGWVREAGGALRRETVRSMLRRLPGWDYRQRAIYQITITLADRSAGPLGRLEVRRREGNLAARGGDLAARGQEQNGGQERDGGQERGVGQERGGDWLPIEVARAARETFRPEEIEAWVVASELGRVVEGCWGEIAGQWPGVRSLGFRLMPDHVHGILFVEKRQEKTLGNIVGSFKSKSASRVKEYLAAHGENLAARGENLAARGQEPNGGQERVGGQGRGEASCSPPRAAGFWAPGYQDTILFHEGQLANMKRYLADNPRRLAIKRLFPDLFRVARELALPLFTGKSRATGFFAALGNRFLLQRPLAQVQVSRRDLVYRRVPKPGGGFKIARDAAGAPIVDFASPSFHEKKVALFAAAKHGATLLSPCVSDGEREIARLALAAGHSLVTLHNKGFSNLQKPAGRHFDACSDGRLLMLAPAEWPYQPGEKPMTRADATAMNRLCQWLVGEDAVEINYHGMKPANIDALARAAAKVVPCEGAAG